MKNIGSYLLISFLIFFGAVNTGFSQTSKIAGAWKLESQNGQTMSNTVSVLIEDGYMFYTEYDVKTKHFEGSFGGIFKIDGNSFIYTVEFSTWQPDLIGVETKAAFKMEGNKLTMSQEQDGITYTNVYSRIDDGKGDLAGAWRITDRMRNGEMSAMRQGPRKTIKMITGTRFQWAAFNPETKQFSGTGGGTVTLENGKYTEHIEFFSRNKDRVGANLTFDYKVDGKKWDHSGLSSTGNPIREIWTRQN